MRGTCGEMSCYSCSTFHHCCFVIQDSFQVYANTKEPATNSLALLTSNTDSALAHRMLQEYIASLLHASSVHAFASFGGFVRLEY